MTGVFGLKTAAELRDKLRRELQSLKADPLNQDAAVNFFVTAESLLDWVYPNRGDPKKRQERDSSTLLQVCSHLANGAKHFELDDRRHKSVASSEKLRGGWTPGDYFGGSFVPAQWSGSTFELIVQLQGEAAAQLGASIAAIDLAVRVMEYWDKHPEI